MKRFIIASFTVLFLVACGSQSAYNPLTDDHLPVEYTEIEMKPTPTPEPAQIPPPEPAQIPTAMSERITEPISFVPPPWEISEYGRQVAKDFLSEMTTIFTTVGSAQQVWDSDKNELVSTGLFSVGWDFETHQPITADVAPKIWFIWNNGGFFDGNEDRIYDAPWLWLSSYHFASSFRLFDFDGNGIPEIFVHFTQTFEGCYGGFYWIFRYIDGQYKMLKYYANGAESSWGLLNSSHNLFFDYSDRIIAVINCELNGMAYEHLVLTDDYAELHYLVGPSGADWDAWYRHHWEEWDRASGVRVDGWMFHNSTIFGTDIPITPIQSLTALEAELTAEITQKLLNNQ